MNISDVAFWLITGGHGRRRRSVAGGSVTATRKSTPLYDQLRALVIRGAERGAWENVSRYFRLKRDGFAAYVGVECVFPPPSRRWCFYYLLSLRLRLQHGVFC